MISSTISLLSWQWLSSLSTLGTNFAQIFHIFNSSQIIVYTVPTQTSNCALIVSIDTQRPYPWNSLFGQSTVVYWLPYSSHTSHHPSQTPCLPRISDSTQKIDARFMQDAPKAVWSIPYISGAFFPSLKQNFIAYHFSKVTSHPDCIFEIHQLGQ